MTGESKKSLKPEFRPFVLRPVFYTLIPSGFLAAGSFFFWSLLQGLVGVFAWAIPAIAVVMVVFVLTDRLVRFSKTRYEINPDRVVVETGSIFRRRTVELDLRNVTLVEWSSPWLLRKFYNVGHVTAQEAGSSAQPATLSYIRDPGEVYALIGEYMRNHGFRMERAQRVQQEQPGHLGAAVDLTASIFAMFWAVILIGVQFAFEALPLIIGEGPSLLQLVLGNYEVFADSTAVTTLVRARIGALLLGSMAVVLTGAGIVIAYVDLFHRTYTLYDDVIDYVDGFLNETRKFIPLENLADTQVSRPFYKRLLGLSDVRLSSQGAENSIAFASTPNGPEFAEAIEGLVRESKRVERDAASAGNARPESARSPERAATSTTTGTYELQPEPIRAAMRGFGLTTLIISGVVGILFDFFGESWDSNFMTAIGLWGALVTAALALAAAAAVGATWWIVKARRTSFAIDERGVRHRVDLFSTNDVRFALERITSISVLRNPLDRLLGTMTVRFRSIGSETDLDFWGIADDPELMAAVRRRFGFESRTVGHPAPHEAPDGRLTPAFGLVDALSARGPFYGFLLMPIVLAAAGTAVWISVEVVYVVLLLGILPVVFVSAHMGMRSWIHHEIQGEFLESHVEVSGGILTRYKHIAPLEHVKAVESVRYFGRTSGELTLRTAGFPVSVGHLPVVKRLHEYVDRRLSNSGTRDDAVPIAEYAPHVGTEMVRHAWIALTLIGLPAMFWFYAYYRRVEYRVGQNRLVGDSGLYFDRRVTVLFDRVDHIESQSNFAHGLFNTHDIEVYTVGSPQTDLVFRSIEEDQRALQTVRSQL